MRLDCLGDGRTFSGYRTSLLRLCLQEARDIQVNKTFTCAETKEPRKLVQNFSYVSTERVTDSRWHHTVLTTDPLSTGTHFKTRFPDPTYRG